LLKLLLKPPDHGAGSSLVMPAATVMHHTAVVSGYLLGYGDDLCSFIIARVDQPSQ